MTLEFRKKYELIQNVIEYYQDNAFTIGELFLICNDISRKYDITLDMKDVVSVVIDLYDSFDLDREILADGIIRYKNAQSKNIVSSRS